MDAIRTDFSAVGPAHPPMLVFLGDYVDRGQDSKEVIEQVLALMADPELDVRALKGNHEEALLQFLQDALFGATWVDYGGRETLQSYGVKPPSLRAEPEDWERARQDLERMIWPLTCGFWPIWN